MEKEKKLLLAYATMTGNTEELAEIVYDQLCTQLKEYEVEKYYIDFFKAPQVFDVDKYEAVFLGTYTWRQGFSPEEVDQFITVNDLRKTTVYLFGTGDIQFGEDLYCLALDKAYQYYGSPRAPLKIEQSPRGEQESKVIEWTNKIIEEMS